MEDKKTVNTYCSVCEHSCGMQVTAQGNEILEIKGLAEHPYSKGYLCPKGLAARDIWSAPDRLKNPLKRDGNDWKPVSWPEALSLCAEKLRDIKDRYGPEGLFIYHGQTYLKSRLAFFLMKRFFNLYGAVNLSSAGSECFISQMLAHFTTFGNLPFPDYERSRCIILWGSNPCASGGIGKSYPQMTLLLKERKKSGAKLIVIDPRLTAPAELADIFIQPRPGTDGALALGFVRTIIDEHLENAAYIEKHTSGFDELRQMLKDYPLDKIAQITGIGQEKIKEAARLFAATKPGCIKVGSGLEHHTNGVQTIRAINILLAITGNIDVDGGNTFLNHTPLSSPDVNILPNDKALGADEHPMFVSMISQAHAVAALDCIVKEKPYPVKGMIVAGGSPLRVLANTGKVEQAMDKMEFIVVIDPFMTETAKRAHLVLPAANFLEREEIDISPFSLQQKVVDPDGPWPDWKIWWELSLKMGYEEHFPWSSVQEIMEHLLETTDYSLEQIRATPGGIAVSEETGKFLRDGFYTYTGKIEIYSKSLESNGYDPLPHFNEPLESPVSTPDIAKDFPLILITGGRYPVFVHSQHRNIAALRKQFPEPLMEIHPDTANTYGVDDGKEAIVESKRGRVRIKAAYNEGMLPGIVHLPHGWDEANCNELTDDEARDPVSGFPGLKSSLCRIKKADR
jgi:anaerobic selenocysteine-containing dehydrogenase